jgi:prepilin-type N-terminal cleavage/methylation domain-containing protein/prepilin-type processing-associated H-X9-DG protein
MKHLRLMKRTAAFTLIELLVVMAIISILASMLMPALSQGTARAKRIQCLNDLKQMGLAFHGFAHDHEGKFPMQVSTNDGGSAELVRAAYRANGESYFAYRHFQALVNDLASPKIFACPTDTRLPADNYPALTNDNISYFVAARGDYGKPNDILVGDRNVTNNTPQAGTVLRLDANNCVRWTEELHRFKGNILFADAHVEQFNHANLLVSSEGQLAATDLILPSVKALPVQIQPLPRYYTPPPAKAKVIATPTNILARPPATAPPAADLAMGTFDQKFVAYAQKSFKWIYLILLLLALAVLAYEWWRRERKKQRRKQMLRGRW